MGNDIVFWDIFKKKFMATSAAPLPLVVMFCHNGLSFLGYFGFLFPGFMTLNLKERNSNTGNTP